MALVRKFQETCPNGGIERLEPGSGLDGLYREVDGEMQQHQPVRRMHQGVTAGKNVLSRKGRSATICSWTAGGATTVSFDLIPAVAKFPNGTARHDSGSTHSFLKPAEDTKGSYATRTSITTLINGDWKSRAAHFRWPTDMSAVLRKRSVTGHREEH